VPVPTGTRPGADVTPEAPVTQAPGSAGGTGVTVSGRKHELTDGTVRSVDAAMRGGMTPYRESRFRRSCQ